MLLLLILLLLLLLSLINFGGILSIVSWLVKLQQSLQVGYTAMQYGSVELSEINVEL